MSSSTFQQAAALNNDGVTALIGGNHMTAVDSLGQAIKLMKTELAERTAATGLTTQTQGAVETIEIPTSMESCDTIVYSQAVWIPVAEAATPSSDADLNVYISYVIFNLALAHHAQGNPNGMEKAETLYGLVLKLLDDDKALTSHHTALIVKLACINNLSQIAYANGDYKKARHSLKQVSSWYMRQSSTNQAIIDEDSQVQGLLMSALLLKAPVAAKAA